ncbi:MAG: PQQ-dependent sugar dehydrogenase [Bacillota bacterium]
MKRRIIIYASIAVLIFSGLTAYMMQQGIFDDEKARVDEPVAQPVGEVEPVLEIVAEDLGLIWAIDLLPGTSKLLANENSGSMFLIDTETLEAFEITGVPEVASGGQGGLLDVTVAPDFADDKLVYLTYTAANEAGETATHLARASLDLDEQRLSGLEVLYVAEPFRGGTSHYGSRVVIQGDYLYMTIGDRGDKTFDDHVAQDPTNVLGTTIRLLRDGTIPEDNPFVGDANVLDEIYTYGHRNSQGMTIHSETGEIWQSEHGERDGDEINIIYGGNNYGWPVATYGCTYATGQDIGILPEEHDDTINPVHYWECGSGGFPPAGMTFYDADGFVDWQGDLFVGGLASEYLAHFRVTGDGLEELDPLLADEGWRVRDVTVGQHDGAIYAAVEGQSVSIARIAPEPVE